MNDLLKIVPSDRVIMYAYDKTKLIFCNNFHEINEKLNCYNIWLKPNEVETETLIFASDC